MKDRETSIIIEFTNKDAIDLSKINLDTLKSFGKAETFKENDKIKAIITQSKTQSFLFVITKKGITGNNMSNKYSAIFKKEIERLAKEILIKVGLKGNEFVTKSTRIEFKSDYSLREKVFSDYFKEKIETILTEAGYNVPEYISVRLALSKDDKRIGIISIEHEGPEEYKKNIVKIEAPEELKDKLKNLK